MAARWQLQQPAYSQATLLPALQLTLLLGVAGLLFVLALVPAALALVGTPLYSTVRLLTAPTPRSSATTLGPVGARGYTVACGYSLTSC